VTLERNPTKPLNPGANGSFAAGHVSAAVGEFARRAFPQSHRYRS